MKKQFTPSTRGWLALLGTAWMILLASACHKTPTPEPDPDLPPATQEGKGTIGCYINGKPWWPKPYLAIGIDPYLRVIYGGLNPGTFSLRGITNENILTIMVPMSAKKGDNQIWYDPFQGYIFTSYDTISFARGCGQFRLDTLKTRRLTITKLDTIGVGIISGTFEFTAFNTCGDTLRFTQGRFDY